MWFLIDHMVFILFILAICLFFLSFFLQVWDCRRRACVHTYKGHGSAITSVAFSPDGSWVVSGAGDCSVKVNYFYYHSKRETHNIREHKHCKRKW